ncbi:unnamed protein product [Rotaria sordida]|uniref:FBD domain-containing protein n=1 Tax=Rotaria sordida TaxID=392033 RepID=A0A819K566_9BILA|nr:unnamed protein product [Rotaria sordida]
MKRSSNGDIYPLAKSILDRFCLQILPKIQHKIKWLNLESLSIKRILLAGYYPNLRGFGLFIVEPETVAHLVLLYDERPFKYEFFIRIAKAFPFLKMLIIENRSPQILNEDNHNLPIVEYPHLIHLDLSSAHDDYIEQLLVNTKTCLSNYIHLVISYRSLQRVTHNFTKDTMRGNCAKVKYLYVCNKPDVPEQLHVYFPHVENL